MRALLIFFVFVSFAVSADVKTIGIPKDSIPLIIDRTLKELKKENLSFETVELDFNKDKDVLKKEIEESVDILFLTGDYFFDINKNMRLKNTYIVFLGSKDIHLQQKGEMGKNSIGVYRSVHSAKLVKQNIEILRDNVNPAILVKKDSALSNLVPALKKSMDDNGINIKFVYYEEMEDFDALFKTLKKQNITSLLAFPSSSIDDSIIFKLIKAQNRYKLPIISQMEHCIMDGALGGSAADYDKIIMALKSHIKALIEGKKPEDLKPSFIFPKYVINLEVASKIDADINQNILTNAKIVGISKAAKEELNEKKEAVKGSFIIAVTKDAPGHMVKRYIKSLESYGLYEDKNIEIKYVPFGDNKLFRNSDLIFATGNTFLKLYKQNPKQPIVVLTKREDIDKVELENRNFTGVIRIAFDKVADTAKKLGYKKTAFIHNVDQKVGMNTKLGAKIMKKRGIASKEYIYKKGGIPEIFEKMKNDEVELVVIFPSAIKKGEIKEVIGQQFLHKLPVIVQTKKDMKKGAMLGIDSKISEAFKYLAKTTDFILKGRNPDEIPLMFHDSDLAINLDSANRLNIKFPKEILEKAKIYTRE